AEVEAMVGNTRRAEFLRKHARKVHRQYNQTFWDAKKGRYIGCIDSHGKVRDFGFTFVNLEAMAYGLADAKQVRKIYNWMENGASATGRRDIYSKWKFAPRATTVRNSTIWRENPNEFNPWWSTDYPGFNYTGRRFSDQIQDGGTSLYISYYDIMTRIRFLGIDRTWQRFSEIMKRYSCPDRLSGGPLMYCGENPQHGVPGSVGTDRPFPESGAVPASFLYAFIGANAGSAGLRIKPDLPGELEFAGVENLYYAGHRYDLRVSRNSVEVVRQSDGKTIERKIRPGGSVLIKPDEK
ncbi:MAG: hypothetical protein QF662_05110, partial [Phycisphaerae bacterium]|nr:hypothetical protein [Phycisphaerae bacterium]